MDKKKGFFAALKDDVVRGLFPSRMRSRKIPARSRSSMTGLLNRLKGSGQIQGPYTEQLVGPSGSMRLVGETSAPLMEGPDTDCGDGKLGASKRSAVGCWMKGQLCRTPSSASFKQRSDLRLLVGVLGAPLAPVNVTATDCLPHLIIKDNPIETSSAHYILQQYIAACGGEKIQSSIKNSYAMGKIKMIASEFETATKVMKNRNGPRNVVTGGFVIWQMNPDMWYVELAVGGSKVLAGCNGEFVWRHTPWLGSHTAKGPVRPLRRTLQGLDPRTTACMFADARCVGEKKISGEDCFILKLCADPQTLKARSEGPAEIIRHVLLGYFSQKTGLLVYMEDSHLTRIQSDSRDTVYWETTINSYLDDYKPVEGITIAHSGRSAVTLFRFGETAMSHSKTRMEEAWTIKEVAFNVPGLSLDCFIPPADLRSSSVVDTCEVSRDERGKGLIALAAHCAKVRHWRKNTTSTLINRGKCKYNRSRRT